MISNNPKNYLRKIFIFLYDAFLIMPAWLGAYWLRFNLSFIPEHVLSEAINVLPFVFVLQIVAYWIFGLNRVIWRFASLPDLIRIIKAVFLGAGLSAIVLFLFFRLENIPRSVFPLYVLLLIVFLGGSRLFYRLSKNKFRNISEFERVLIIGAGQAGEGLVRDFLRDINSKYKPIAFVDDDEKKIGQEIHGIRVVAAVNQLTEVVKSHFIELIIIAIPSASSNTMQRIVNLCEETKVPFRTLPSLKDLASGHVSINSLRKVSIEDLLGREAVVLNRDQISNEIKDKTVLVSGGGGSIGSELCRQIAVFLPKKLIVLEQSEFNLYSIELEFKQKFPHVVFEGYLVDVSDKVAVNWVVESNKPQIIFHAAAYKHVPILEAQLRTAVKNNILGTCSVAEAAVNNHVEKFILISTDKAVNPTNIMGATKRAAEIFCQNINKHSSTRFITVRFGNVLDSAGSVVPLFRKQIAQGGPVTVTHPEITRYFMTISEASQLILQAMLLGQGGEIFVLDMGEPIKIRYLAEQMIKLSGLKLNEDIHIEYVGLRPGEKLFEELFHESEALVSTIHNKILQARSRDWDWNLLLATLAEMNQACHKGDEVSLKNNLSKLVPEYQSATK